MGSPHLKPKNLQVDIEISTGGPNLTNLWRYEATISSKKVEVVLLGLPEVT
jgi:hypothetical protein